jgi:hypothetical protein
MSEYCVVVQTSYPMNKLGTSRMAGGGTSDRAPQSASTRRRGVLLQQRLT